MRLCFCPLPSYVTTLLTGSVARMGKNTVLKQRLEIAGMSLDGDQGKIKTIKLREKLCCFYILLLALQFAKDMGRVRQTEGFALQKFPALFMFLKNVTLKKTHTSESSECNTLPLTQSET